jgi:NADH-quinone oxidoreductase subunit K
LKGFGEIEGIWRDFKRFDEIEERLMVPTSYYLILGALIFTIGAVGVLTRRSALIIFMCVEMMLNSVNLTLIALSRQWGNLNGQIFVFMIMAVAAAEVAVGLAIVIAHQRHTRTTNIDEINLLKW